MISVLMPVFNAEKYLREAIESILNQSYTDFEFLIINDGSTDETENIILSYNDSRIIYVKNEHNLQIIKTLNKGIKLAKGEYIARMDADDISLPKRLKIQYNFMEAHKNIDICGTWIKTFGVTRQIWKYPINHEEIKANLLLNSALAHPSVIIRKAVFDKFIYKDEFNYAEDYALWVEAINIYKFHNIPKILLKYRLHINQTNKKNQINKTNKIRKIILKKEVNNLTDEDLFLFMNISNYIFIPFSHFIIILNKVLNSIRKKKNINDKIMFQILMKRYLLTMSQYKHIDLITLFKFTKLSFKNFFIPPLTIYFKCIQKWFVLNIYKVVRR